MNKDNLESIELEFTEEEYANLILISKEMNISIEEYIIRCLKRYIDSIDKENIE